MMFQLTERELARATGIPAPSLRWKRLRGQPVAPYQGRTYELNHMILGQLRARYAARQPWGLVQWIAQETGLSKSQISLMMRGKRRISLDAEDRLKNLADADDIKGIWQKLERKYKETK